MTAAVAAFMLWPHASVVIIGVPVAIVTAWIVMSWRSDRRHDRAAP